MGITANKIRPGTIVVYEGSLWICMEAVHKTPGNKRAFVQVKFRHVKDGTQKEYKLASDEILEKASLIEKEMQFLYKDETSHHFMDTGNYEQIQLSRELIGSSDHYLLPECKVLVTFYEDIPIGVKLPQKMTFKIIEAEPNLSSATATTSFKNAIIETGLTVKVPPFVEPGESVVINTETGEYAERAK